MNVNLPQEFSERLREERKRLEMNQTEFAKAAGVHLNTQSRYEKGERAPDTAYLGAIAKVGVDMAFLLTGERGQDIQGELKSQRDSVQAIQHLLNEIQGFLGFWKPPLSYEFEQALQDAYEARKVVWTNPEVVERADRKLREMLLKSAEVLPTVTQLEYILQGLDIIEARVGTELSPYVKAASLRKIYQEEKHSGRRLGLDEMEQIVRSHAHL